MKYVIEIVDREIPGRPRFFRAVMRDESNPQHIQHLAIHNNECDLRALLDGIRQAIEQRESHKSALAEIDEAFATPS